jgi:nicotinamidase-related amidase
MLEEICIPGRPALVVYDMQIGILSQLKNADEIVARVSRVLAAAREAGARIFFMRHLSLPRELMGVFQYRMAMAWQRVDDPAKVNPWFLRDSPGFAITPERAPRPSEAIFDKLTMSAFEGTPLSIAMRDCGISAVALGHADAAQRSIDSLKFAGDVVLTDTSAFCQAILSRR